jgi:hypothetical protein
MDIGSDTDIDITNDMDTATVTTQDMDIGNDTDIDITNEMDTASVTTQDMGTTPDIGLSCNILIPQELDNHPP